MDCILMIIIIHVYDKLYHILKNKFSPTVIEININFHNWPIFQNYYSHK